VKLHDALNVALIAWAFGKLKTDDSDASRENVTDEELHKVLSESLSSGRVEAALLERHSQRERRFRLLSDSEVKPIISAFQRV
jgi:predicted methyltransferase MtxX (methanogen marker protein 4)